ncbi:MAG: hypothetical protein EOM50_12655 [Erysipelotrichia bacterium]|nr:hypothetical protein [Erysipelotrichia bacterium]NCC54434.1 hypothetical protein [Erysipelotrichia bacterium]
MKRNTKSISFLMEFIIVVFFFALSSAICTSVYAHAEKMNTLANDKKTALIIASNYIEGIHLQTQTTLTFNQEGTVSKDSYFTLKVNVNKKEQVNEVKVYHQQECLITLPYALLGGNDDEA